MDIKLNGTKLQEKWGDAPCDHPSFIKEWIGAPISGLGYVEKKTGDYICSQCGQVFTKEEVEEIIRKRQK